MKLELAKAMDRVAGDALARVLGWTDMLGAFTQRPAAPIPHVRRLLVVKFWGLGNWALLRPIVADLRARWPDASLTIATLSANRPLVEDLADDLMLVRAGSATEIMRDVLRTVAWLRRHPHDLALDFEQFARTGALLLRLGRAGQRLGFRAGVPARDQLYSATVPFRTDRHVTRSFRDLAEAAGVTPGPYVPGGLSPTPAGCAQAASFLARGAPLVLHPGSGDNFPGRRWSPAGFAALGRKALRLGVPVVVTGAPGELDLARGVARAVGTVDGATARCAAGALSLSGLVGLLAGARVLASNDTGPVHLASQLGVPVLAFFGPNTPVLYGPLSPGSHSFYRTLPCSPCLTTANYRSSRCRIHTCMASIPVGEAVHRLEQCLRSTSHQAPHHVKA